VATVDGPTRLGFSAGDKVFLLVVGPLVGLLAGWALPLVARWAADLPWAPFQGPLELVASWQSGWSATAFLVVGAAAGTGLAMYIMWESLHVRLDERTLVLRSRGTERSFPRGDVTAVFLDRKQLVVLDRESRELARGEIEAKAPAVAQAFGSHGFPWYDADPYADAYCRWVPDSPDVSEAANAVLAAREKALAKKDSADAADLKAEVARLGYVVRDEARRQYWRPLDRRTASG
jgi:hypothetical protein